MPSTLSHMQVTLPSSEKEGLPQQSCSQHSLCRSSLHLGNSWETQGRKRPAELIPTVSVSHGLISVPKVPLTFWSPRVAAF